MPKEHFHPRIEFSKNRVSLGLLALTSLLLLTACQPTSKYTGYYPEKGNPPAEPQSSIMTPGGAEFDFYFKDGSDFEDNIQNVVNFISSSCQKPIHDKKIPVYFKSEPACDDCAGQTFFIDNAKTQIAVEIYPKQINNIFRNPNTLAIECENLTETEYFDERIGFHSFCQNPITYNNPDFNLDLTLVHEIAGHVCGETSDEKYASGLERQYTEQNWQMKDLPEQNLSQKQQ